MSSCRRVEFISYFESVLIDILVFTLHGVGHTAPSSLSGVPLMPSVGFNNAALLALS